MMNERWIVLPRNFGRSKWVTATGLIVGFFLSWFLATSLRATWIFFIADKDTSFNRLPLLIALFLPEIFFLIYRLSFREIRNHFRELESRYFVHEQDHLRPLDQYVPEGMTHLAPQQVLRGAFLSGFVRSGLILLVSMAFMIGFYGVFAPDNDGRPYREFALTRSLMIEPANSFFFPNPVEAIIRNQGISQKGRCLGEAAFAGQLLSIFVFVLLWYLRFAKREMNREYAADSGVFASVFSPFGPLRGGDMT